jgi:hypothetical protein
MRSRRPAPKTNSTAAGTASPGAEAAAPAETLVVIGDRGSGAIRTGTNLTAAASRSASVRRHA